MDSGKQAWPEHKENGAGSVRDQVQETASVLGSRRDPSHAEGPIWPPWPYTGRGAPLSQLCTAPIAVPRGSPEPRDRLAHPNQLRPFGFLNHSHPDPACAGGVCVSPARVAVAPRSWPGSSVKRNRERNR